MGYWRAAPHLPPHVRGNGVGARGTRRAQRLLDEPPALRVLREDEVEPALEDLRRAPARAGVRERILRRLELLEEAARDRDVQARKLRVERFDLVAGRLREEPNHGGSDPGGRRRFTM
jgi:hypothetical protein